MQRCAVVLSGHTLRCGERWARLIDSSYYDAVFRTNWGNLNSVRRRRQLPPLAGSRVDFSQEMDEADCAQLTDNAACISPNLTAALSNIEIETLGVAHASGLGFGRSGGSVLNVALAHCETVDVFGSGMFSHGPGSDTIYQHWYDERFANDCRPHSCMAQGHIRRTNYSFSGSEAQAWESLLARRRSLGLEELCRPESPCTTFSASARPGAARAIKAAGRASENPNDFFFLSELRLYVLQSLGWVRWVWY